MMMMNNCCRCLLFFSLPMVANSTRHSRWTENFSSSPTESGFFFFFFFLFSGLFLALYLFRCRCDEKFCLLSHTTHTQSNIHKHTNSLSNVAFAGRFCSSLNRSFVRSFAWSLVSSLACPLVRRLCCSGFRLLLLLLLLLLLAHSILSRAHTILLTQVYCFFLLSIDDFFYSSDSCRFTNPTVGSYHLINLFYTLQCPLKNKCFLFLSHTHTHTQARVLLIKHNFIGDLFVLSPSVCVCQLVYSKQVLFLMKKGRKERVNKRF